MRGELPEPGAFATYSQDRKAVNLCGILSIVFPRAPRAAVLLAAAMIEVEGEPMRPVTWVRIKEFEGGDWAIGGRGLQAADVHALAAGKRS